MIYRAPVNAIVAASNIFCLIPVVVAFTKRDPVGLVALYAGIASTLMHLAESKHRLPGLMFRDYHNELLWLDRVTALMAGSYAVYCWWVGGANSLVWLTALPGLVCLFVSENLCDWPEMTRSSGNATTVRQYEMGRRYFCAWHCAWHVLAYVSLALVF
jgi:hypothetical protein